MKTNLPSSFYEHLDACRDMGLACVCFGVPRSASTMLYQVARDVFPSGGVVKTHSYLAVPPEVPVVATIRDFRDAAVSWWRVQYAERQERNAREVARMMGELGSFVFHTHKVKPALPGKMGIEDAVWLAGEFKRWVFALDQWRERHAKLLVLRYENFAVAPASWLCEPLSMLLGIEVTPDTVSLHDLKHNWGLKRFTDVPVYGWDAANAKGPVEGGHCHEGKAGTWREFCEPDMQAELTRMLWDELVRYGYESEPEIPEEAVASDDAASGEM